MSWKGVINLNAQTHKFTNNTTGSSGIVLLWITEFPFRNLSPFVGVAMHALNVSFRDKGVSLHPSNIIFSFNTKIVEWR